jgi:hypothetical protein
MRKRIGGGVGRDTAFNGGEGGADKFSVMKVPTQCPFVFLVKVG